MDDPLIVGANLRIPLREVIVRASRSSGPGGQHANVTSSRVEASFEIAASRSLDAAQRRRLHDRYGPRVVAVAQEHRSQPRNRQLALERLRARIAAGLEVQAPRQPTRPTFASRQRRLEDKRRRGARKRTRRVLDDD